MVLGQSFPVEVIQVIPWEKRDKYIGDKYTHSEGSEYDLIVVDTLAKLKPGLKGRLFNSTEPTSKEECPVDAEPIVLWIKRPHREFKELDRLSLSISVS